MENKKKSDLKNTIIQGYIKGNAVASSMFIPISKMANVTQEVSTSKTYVQNHKRTTLLRFSDAHTNVILLV